MKRSVLFLILGILSTFCYSQDILNSPNLSSNDFIPQLSSVGLSNVMSIQDMNYGLNSQSYILQMGNMNKSVITQSKNDPGLTNKSLNFQIGNNNDLTVDQIGSGNLLLSFQFGYLTLESFDRAIELYGLSPPTLMKETGNEDDKVTIIVNEVKNEENLKNDYLIGSGEGNKIEVTQEGTNNAILAIQEGDHNFISAGQKGYNNNLLVIQRGNGNAVKEYKQGNYSSTALYDTIIQEGENLSIETDGVAKNNTNGSLFSQVGTNLTLVMGNEFLNPIGGLEISQKGEDMKVEINQSYFPDPLR